MAISNVFNKDILVNAPLYSGAKYGVQVIDYTYVAVDGVETKLFIVQSGKVQDEEWVPVKGADNVFIYTEESLIEQYTQKWAKPRFKDGTFLKASDGAVFFYENKDKVWRVAGNTYGGGASYASLASRESDKGRLIKFESNGGDDFTDLVKKALNKS